MWGVYMLLTGSIMLVLGITAFLGMLIRKNSKELVAVFVLMCLVFCGIGLHMDLSGLQNIMVTSEEQFEISQIIEGGDGYEITSTLGNEYYYYGSLYESELHSGDLISANVSPMKLGFNDKEINSFEVITPNTKAPDKQSNPEHIYLYEKEIQIATISLNSNHQILVSTETGEEYLLSDDQNTPLYVGTKYKIGYQNPNTNETPTIMEISPVEI